MSSWNICFIGYDGYVLIVVITIPSSFPRMWPTEWDTYRQLYIGFDSHVQHDGCHIRARFADPSGSFDNASGLWYLMWFV